jgi:tetratricopeptide (TPR) repeat protein
MLKKSALLLIMLSLSSLLAASENTTDKSIYEKPLIERYVLDELKALRTDQQDLERRLIIEITDRELSVADKSLGYASNTVTYIFYIIAAVASLIAMIGWQSLREIRENTKKMAGQQIQLISKKYEEKFEVLEKDLRRKTRRIADNHIEIENINDIHTLWVRAQKSSTPEEQMEIYDEILNIRPGDLEALTSKADAAIAMKEFHWALSICNSVLEVDKNNINALYQRACAYACLGAEDQAVNDLARAIAGRISLRELAVDEADFDSLRGNETFESLLANDA